MDIAQLGRATVSKTVCRGSNPRIHAIGGCKEKVRCFQLTDNYFSPIRYVFWFSLHRVKYMSIRWLGWEQDM